MGSPTKFPRFWNLMGKPPHCRRSSREAQVQTTKQASFCVTLLFPTLVRECTFCTFQEIIGLYFWYWCLLVLWPGWHRSGSLHHTWRRHFKSLCFPRVILTTWFSFFNYSREVKWIHFTSQPVYTGLFFRLLYRRNWELEERCWKVSEGVGVMTKVSS